MAASENDKITYVGEPGTATTLSSPGYTVGNTSINVGSTTNFPSATGVIFAIDVAEVINGEEVRVDGSYCVFAGKVASGTSINGLTLLAGTPQDYAAGALTRVYITTSSQWVERLVDGLLAQHSQLDGSHTTITVSGVATFSNHIDVNDSSTAIRDTSDNELVKFAKTASAVNEVTVQNAATANAPQIQATGGDSNVDLRLVPKGTGNIKRGSTGGSIDWWEEIGRTTLTVAGDTISIPTIPVRKYLKILLNVQPTGGTVNTGLRFNNDSGANYAFRRSINGAADATAVGETYFWWDIGSVAAFTVYSEIFVVNIATQEKIGSGFAISSGTAGAGNAPLKVESVDKWANTVSAITRVDCINVSGSGDFAIGSELVVLGHD